MSANTAAIVAVLSRNPLRVQKLLDTIDEWVHADPKFLVDLVAAIDPSTSGVVGALKANPDVLNRALDMLDTASAKDPSLMTDLLAAIASKSYTGFVVAHPAFMASLFTILASSPDLLKALSGLA